MVRGLRTPTSTRTGDSTRFGDPSVTSPESSSVRRHKRDLDLGLPDPSHLTYSHRKLQKDSGTPDGASFVVEVLPRRESRPAPVGVRASLVDDTWVTT